MDNPTLTALQRLIEIVAQLRSPEGGCPWDLAQTPQTLIPYIIEEAYEAVAALQSENTDDIAEELGDLLLQVVLQSQIAQEYGQFDLATVANGISDKLIRRHPHVFGDLKTNDVEQVRANWDAIKAQEKGLSPEVANRLSYKLARYARTLPPIAACAKISHKSASAGFEWECIEDVWAKFEEELAEFKEAVQSEDKAHQAAELGDLLFTVINLARWYKIDPAQALQGTNQRFINRLTKIEDVADRPLTDYSLEELEALWQQAKQQLAQG
ncbi:MAG: nucleoside triphosphate pyrophosphohydrolase [Spirulina sp. SIO3F2]|nr:nucleoside triphosphate pyrophosphohydrolase [Spirulina sp. SIO3F2]